MKKLLLVTVLLLIAISSRGEEVVFDFDVDYATLFPDLPGTSSNESHSGDITSPLSTISIDGVTITISPKTSTASTDNRIWQASPRLRVYSGTITVESQNKSITNISFASNANFNIASADCGTLDSHEWTGNTSRVVFTIQKNTQIKNIHVVTDGTAPVTKPTLYQIDFTKSQTGWQVANNPTNSLDSWVANSYGFVASNTNGTFSESYLLSPLFDLSQVSDVELIINHIANKFADLYPVQDLVAVAASVNDGKFEDLEVAKWPDGKSWTPYESAVDISHLAGKGKVRFAFIYKTYDYADTDTQEGEYEVTNFKLKGSGTISVLKDEPLIDLSCTDLTTGSYPNFIDGYDFSYTLENKAKNPFLFSQISFTQNVYLEDKSGTRTLLSSKLCEDWFLPNNQPIKRSENIYVDKPFHTDGDAYFCVEVIPSPEKYEPSETMGDNFLKSKNTIGISTFLHCNNTAVTINENGGEATLTITRSGDWSKDETFIIDTERNRIDVPTSITIPAYTSSTTLKLRAIDNKTVDTDNIVVLSFHDSLGCQKLRIEVTIVDDDQTQFAAQFTTNEITEGETTTLKVSLAAPMQEDLKINLVCDHAARFRFPQSVIIPAGETSIDIEIAAIDNTEPNNIESVEFLVTATGYDKASAILLLNDNDIPSIDLTISPEEVNEDAGANAAFATIRRSGVTTNKVTIRLSDNSNGLLLYNTDVVMEKDEIEKIVGISIIDNNLVDGTRDIDITADVYISTCNCTAVGTKESSVTRKLRIYDNDGPTLSITSDRTMILEGDNRGSVITVTRNTDTTEALTILLQANISDVEMPSQITIPAGQSSVTFNVVAKANTTQEGNRLLTIRAEADGFNCGSAWLYITDQTIPDMAVRKIALSNDCVTVGEEYDVAVTIANEGMAILPERSVFNISSNGQSLAMTITDAIDIQEEKTVHVKLKAPDVPGKYQINVECNTQKAFSEIQTLNNTATTTINVVSPYNYTISTDQDTYRMGETVKISGDVVNAKGNASGILVEPYVMLFNARTALTATTDSNGHFYTEYALPEGLAGDFSFGVCMPGENDKNVMKTVSVYGMSRSTTSYIKNYLYKDEPYECSIDLKNLSSLPLHNIKMTVKNDMGHYRFTAGELPVIDANATAMLPLTIVSNKLTEENAWEKTILEISSDEGATLNVVLYNFTNTRSATLVINTPAINTNISNKRKSIIPVVLTNTGLGETGTISVDVPTNQTLVSVVGNGKLPSLAYGDSATIMLAFDPSNLDVNVVQKGNVAVNCENADGQLITFNVKVVGEDKGNLRVLVEDETTIYGDANGNHPYVAGAKVSIKDYNTGAALFTSITDTDGKVLFTDITEGYYTLYVEADKHDSYIQNVLISPAETMEHVATISYNAISIKWNVEPTEVQDEYELTSEMIYETNVPVPVVAMEMPQELNLLDVDNGSDLLFNVTLTNKGLITAKNVSFTTPQKDGFDFIPLAEYAGFDLAPKQSVTIPVYVTKSKAENSKDQQAKMSIEYEDIINPECSGDSYTSWEWVCVGERTAWVGKTIRFLTRSCPANQAIVTDPQPGTEEIRKPDPPKDGPEAGDPKIPYVKTPARQMDLYGAYQWTSRVFCNMSCLLPKRDEKIDKEYVISIIECALQESGSHAKGYRQSSTDELRSQYILKYKLIYNIDNNIWNYYSELCGAPLLTGDKETFNSLIPCMETIAASIKQLHEEGTLYTVNPESIYNKALLSMPQNCPDWYDFNLREFIDRLINTLKVRDGIDITGSNVCNRVTLDSCQTNLTGYEKEMHDMGFVDRTDLIRSLNDDADAINNGTSNVCATVSLQLSQEMVMTRQAFRGTLQIDNETDVPLTDIMPTIVVTDEEGSLATSHEMQIEIEKVEGFTEQANGDYSLDASSMGTITYLFIPTKYAAPTQAKTYKFGGALRFDDGNGLKSRTLYPVALQVKPSPELDLTYFIQRDLYGDNPMTPDEVEPVIPSEFTVLIQNKGMGEAENVRMITHRPEVIENEKGLLVDFSIVSSSLNGKPSSIELSDNVATDFKTIPAGGSAYASWGLACSLMGHFKDYDVTYTHLTSYGNPDLSLLDKVTVHELIHSVDAAVGGNRVRAWVTNDVADAENAPDHIYLANGDVEDVFVLSDDASLEKISDASYRLTVTVPTSEWFYVALDNYAQVTAKIVKVTNENTGEVLYEDNVWTTDYTLRDGMDPIKERLLHMVDFAAEGGTYSYNIEFEELTSVKSLSGMSKIDRVAVYDISGKLLRIANNANGMSDVNLSSLPHGTYILQIHSGGRVINKKVIR